MCPMRTEAVLLVSTTCLTVDPAAAHTRSTRSVPSIAGLYNSFSGSLALWKKGEAVWSTIVTPLTASAQPYTQYTVTY